MFWCGASPFQRKRCGRSAAKRVPILMQRRPFNLAVEQPASSRLLTAAAHRRRCADASPGRTFQRLPVSHFGRPGDPLHVR
jgi:hypothetical protein